MAPALAAILRLLCVSSETRCGLDCTRYDDVVACLRLVPIVIPVYPALPRETVTLVRRQKSALYNLHGRSETVRFLLSLNSGGEAIFEMGAEILLIVRQETTDTRRTKIGNETLATCLNGRYGDVAQGVSLQITVLSSRHLLA